MCKPAFRDLALDLSMALFQEGKDKGFDFKDIAQFIGSSENTIRHYFYGEATPSLSVFIGACKRIKPLKTLKMMADWSNAVVIKLPESHKGELSTITEQTSVILRETADVINEVSDAIRDGRIDMNEQGRIVREINEAIEALIIFRESMKGHGDVR